MPHPLGKFDEKHNDKVANLVWQIILQLVPNFVHKLVPEHPKMVLATACEYRLLSKYISSTPLTFCNHVRTHLKYLIKKLKSVRKNQSADF